MPKINACPAEAARWRYETAPIQASSLPPDLSHLYMINQMQENPLRKTD